jgi:hypothetical protein
LPPTAS